MCNNMVGTREFYSEWYKTDRGGQMPYDFTYTWNLRNKINDRNRLTDTENILKVARYKGSWGDR